MLCLSGPGHSLSIGLGNGTDLLCDHAGRISLLFASASGCSLLNTWLDQHQQAHTWRAQVSSTPTQGSSRQGDPLDSSLLKMHVQCSVPTTLSPLHHPPASTTSAVLH